MCAVIVIIAGMYMELMTQQHIFHYKNINIKGKKKKKVCLMLPLQYDNSANHSVT